MTATLELTESARARGRRRDRALLSSAGASLVSRLVTASASIVTIDVAAHALDRPAFGVVAVLTTLVVYLGFGDFGLGTMLMTRLPAAHARGDLDAMRDLVRSTVAALSLLAAVLAGAGAVSAFAVRWARVLGAPQLATADVRAAVLCFFVFGAVSIPATTGARILAAMQRGALIRVWNGAVAITTVLTVLACRAAGLPMWTYVAAIAGPPAVLGTVQSVWTVTRTYPYLRPSGAVARLPAALAILRSGSLYVLLSFGWIVAYTVDTLVVSTRLGAASAAVFAVAARMFNLVGGTLQIAGQQMWPALAEALARGDTSWVRSRFRRSLYLSAGVATGACLILVALGRPVARVWVGTALAPPVTLLLAFAAWTVVFTVITQYSYLLTAAEQIRPLALITLVMAPANLALSIWLTSSAGLSGPVLGSLAATFLVQVWPLVHLSRRYLSRLDGSAGFAGLPGLPAALPIRPRPSPGSARPGRRRPSPSRSCGTAR